ncbi:Hydroxyacyl-coenzyme A dehydrogenase, mitochondrial [Hypsibius exemplaris]|uniref:3-hydroxyacyl-CoA dehydrogenase n=1 Tax=Hypsibius exemplaris TaxID=2072580 RepID=A0A1W0WP04_HYPEX|nr:Hydroxyacyl-coenzyme A dehydrogenase, mitochondrial [Hypsibius exemplaris]
MLASVIHSSVRNISSRKISKIKDVMIVGSGLMGAGIAQVAAAAGMNVHLVDQSSDALERAKEQIKDSMGKFAKKQFPDDKQKAQTHVQETMGKIRCHTDPCVPAGQADIIIEAIVENLEVKRDLFHRLDVVAANHTIFASNTSSLSIGAIAASTSRRDRFGGLHFFSPVPMMKLLEVIRIDQTSDDTFDSMMEFAKTIGKAPVACKDTPGFIVNRLLIPYMCEAVRMVERGDATPADIDTAMQLGAGYKIGPLALMDFTGVDLGKHIIDGWHKADPTNPVFQPSGLIDKMVREGKFGRKSGHGFYDYSQQKDAEKKKR